MKIAVYAIAKDEAHFVDRFMAGCAGADAVVICDTGSTDGTAERARAAGATVHEIHVRPWRFDRARDAALALVPPDIDVCIALDLDEVLEPGWREALEAAWVEGTTTRLRYTFAWSPDIVFTYEKIHARWGYRWHHPVHEYPRPDGRITEVFAFAPTLRVSHFPDPTKSRGQYMPLLEMAVAEDPVCPRNAFYHGRELTFHRRWPEAETALTRYLALPGANWANERAYAMRLLGDACEAMGRPEDALSWRWKAVGEAPDTREPWHELAHYLGRRGDWAGARMAAERCLAIDERPMLYMQDPAAWGAGPHDALALAAHHLGDRETAVRAGEEAVAAAPEDLRYRQNLEWYRGAGAVAA